MVSSAGKVCVSMPAEKISEAASAFDFGRYGKFEPKKLLMTLPYKIFMISSEAFKGFEPRFASVLFTSKVPCADPERFGYVVAVKDDRLEIDSLCVSRNGRTLSGVSYSVPIDGRRSVNGMAYEAVSSLKDVMNIRRGNELRSLHDAVAADLSALIPCLAWLADANGKAVSNRTSTKSQTRPRMKGMPGNPDVTLESDLLPKPSAAAPNPKAEKPEEVGRKRKYAPRRPHPVRGYWKRKNGKPGAPLIWVNAYQTHKELMATSNPVRKRV